MPTVIQLPKEVEGKEPRKLKNTNRLINNITFFGDSAIPEDDDIYRSVWNAARYLAEKDFTIVNGGGPGIMKAATDGAESVGGETIAVYWEPKLASFFEGKNLANITDESEASSNYVMRTLGLIGKGDAYVVCKGGTGTISEFGLVWCLAKLYYGCHKPVILYGDFWDDLVDAFQKTMNIDETELAVLYQATNPEQLFDIIQKHEILVKDCRTKHYEGDELAFVISDRAKMVSETYNKVATSYHSEHAGKLMSQDQLDDFIKLVNPPAQVLDIGCGPGFDMKYLSQKYSVTGLDISTKFIDIARYENPGSDIYLGDIVTFDIGTAKYKGIWARDSIHHIAEKDLDKVFQKISDALVDEGVLYVLVREGEGEITETEKKDYSTIERFYHLFSAEELTNRAEKAGMKVIKIDHTKRSHKWLIGVFQK